MSTISVIILTYNEEQHLSRCIASVKSIAQRIIVIDSYSCDKTIEIAKNHGVDIYQNKWFNYANQFNWALENTQINTDWIFRLDADEYLTEQLKDEIKIKIPLLEPNIAAINIKRRVYFLGKWMKHGGIYPTYLPRIWKTGYGKIESRNMDEHLVLSGGKFHDFEYDLVDENLNTLDWWSNKHIKYALREALDISLKEELEKKENITSKITGSQAERKRFIKNIYLKFPLFIRPSIYFLWRYIFRLGFLDGREGFVWNFLQAYWYRVFVDCVLLEAEKKSSIEGVSASEWIKNKIYSP
ncbi:Glycosyltransferase involved in cell wall bisynthesis [Thiothrix caldifontis]|uniref:Glycosyltransferase involved in cell wall bisynthesis n=1 Tax=Thiothrix caldifontis TaxID=525918 RepID=A0A1H4DM56_9GAMM|nr:glycosyltransferase family 2 protein [Thiothrix caldifontis]SEA73616.1 Glycosyltransferase involved in cell wall bisynthesis [Thiothrix caldifontis]